MNQNDNNVIVNDNDSATATQGLLLAEKQSQQGTDARDQQKYASNKRVKTSIDNTNDYNTINSSTTTNNDDIHKVCLFGTSGNPPTGECGHVGIVKLLVSTKQFSEIRILPVYSHSFVTKHKSMASYKDRMNMCSLAFGNLSTKTTKVCISNDEERCYNQLVTKQQQEEQANNTGKESCKEAELQQQEQSMTNIRVGTASLLDMLLEEDMKKEVSEGTATTTTTTDSTAAATGSSGGATTSIEYTFCLGADTFLDLTEWKWVRSKDVLKLLQGRLLVLFRHGVKRRRKATAKNKNTTTTNATTTAVPSTTKDQDEDHEEMLTITQEYLQERIDKVNEMEEAYNNVKLLKIDDSDNENDGESDNSIIKLNDISSTKIRSYCTNSDGAISKHLKDKPEIIHPKVLQYIQENNLYGFESSESSSP